MQPCFTNPGGGINLHCQIDFSSAQRRSSDRDQCVAGRREFHYTGDCPTGLHYSHVPCNRWHGEQFNPGDLDGFLLRRERDFWSHRQSGASRSGQRFGEPQYDCQWQNRNRNGQSHVSGGNWWGGSVDLEFQHDCRDGSFERDGGPGIHVSDLHGDGSLC